MLAKSRLRSILRDVLIRLPTDHTCPAKDVRYNRRSNKEFVTNTIVERFDNKVIQQILGGSYLPGGFIKIIAKDNYNAQDIKTCLDQRGHELVESCSIIDLDRGMKVAQRLLPEQKGVYVKLNIDHLLRSALSNLHSKNDFHRWLRRETIGDACTEQQRVVIDFSSPNIAKPIHFGHLKSTILGNFLSNLHKYLGNHVTKINYIGDWGTQYGILNLALDQHEHDLFGNTDKLPSEKVRELVDIYASANNRANVDELFLEKAKVRFKEMTEDPVQMQRWHQIREWSLHDLTQSYERLGVEFDAYEYESDYSSRATDLMRDCIADAAKSSFLRAEADGSVSAELQKNNSVYRIPVIKSDGTSLYISRDVAAAIGRWNKYKFDKMLYVAGSDQERHFYSLSEILRRMGHEWHCRLEHVTMGKVRGMSSRTGEFVLLSDILDELESQFLHMTKSTPTSKVQHDDVEGLSATAHQLALSALFVHDMRNLRYASYNFSWSQALDTTNRSGIDLQTCHARLVSLIDKAQRECKLEPIGDGGAGMDALDTDAVRCVEALNLLSVLDELDTAMHNAHLYNDPLHLVSHAFDLCRATNRARRSAHLKVLGEPDEKKAVTRLSLFCGARTQLKFIIELLGLRALDRV